MIRGGEHVFFPFEIMNLEQKYDSQPGIAGNVAISQPTGADAPHSVCAGRCGNSFVNNSYTRHAAHMNDMR